MKCYAEALLIHPTCFTLSASWHTQTASVEAITKRSSGIVTLCIHFLICSVTAVRSKSRQRASSGLLSTHCRHHDCPVKCDAVWRRLSQLCYTGEQQLLFKLIKTESNVLVHWLALLRIRDVHGSNLGPKTGYPEVFLSSSKKHNRKLSTWLGMLHTDLGSRGSSGSVVSDYGLDDRAIGVRSPAGAKDFTSILCVQTGSEAHPASCTMGTGGPFPGGKARPGRDADHSPPSSAEVVNE
jgi:hypothetical protein